MERGGKLFRTLGLRLGAAAQVKQHSPAIKMRNSGLGRKADSLGGFFQCALQIVAVGKRERQVKVGRSQIRSQLHHFPKKRDPLARHAHLRLRLAHGGQRGGVLWRKRDGFVQFLIGVGYAALLGKNQAEVQVAFLVFRIVFKTLAKGFRRNPGRPFWPGPWPDFHRASTSCGSRSSAASSHFCAETEIARRQRQVAQFRRSFGILRVDLHGSAVSRASFVPFASCVASSANARL